MVSEPEPSATRRQRASIQARTSGPMAMPGRTDQVDRCGRSDAHDQGSWIPPEYEHEVFGFNSRMDALQAVVLSAKLRRLEGWNAARRAAAARYDEMLSAYGDIRLPSTLAGNEHVWHLYVVRAPHRDRVLKELQSAGIGAGIHYPVPVHLTRAFAELGHPEGTFPVAECTAREILSLPIFPEITQAEQERVASVLIAALR